MPRIYPGGVFTANGTGRTYVLASNSDVVQDIRKNRADFALLGSDKFKEIKNTKRLQFEPIVRLNCQMVLAVPENKTAEGQLTIATSYPRQLSEFLGRTGINGVVGPKRAGKVEGACRQGIANAIFDIKESGDSLAQNGLQVIAEGEYLELGGYWKEEANSIDTLLYNGEQL